MQGLLSNADILQYNNFIDGKWLAGAAEEITVDNPATGGIIGQIATTSQAQIIAAIDAAAAAQTQWQFSSLISRQELLLKWSGLLQDNINDIAKIITAENGKPIIESKDEVHYAISYMLFYAEELTHLCSRRFSGIKRQQIAEIHYEPIGVAALITPWNFPLAMLARKMAAAIAAGCAVICKPASLAPFSALALGYFAKQAGCPDGVVNILLSDAKLFANNITEDSRVRKLSFTGSTAVGKALIAKSASRVLRLSLELGGNAPALVLADADLKQAAEKIAAAKFRGCGQTCICVNRILVDKKVLDAFVAELLAIVKRYRVGNGLTEKTNIGPLISSQARQNAIALIEESVKDGAKLIHGGQALDELGDCFMQPAILTNTNNTMRLCQEEIFAPIAPVMSFKDLEEGIKEANNTEYGLAAYLFTGDEAKANYLARRLQFGMVGINETAISNPRAPFGGIKESGYGREGGTEGLLEYLNLKYITRRI